MCNTRQIYTGEAKGYFLGEGRRILNVIFWGGEGEFILNATVLTLWGEN